MTNLSLNIDLTKVDKTKLYKGAKGTYLDAAIIMKDEPDQYGNIGMIVQSLSKEDRAAGLKGAILGNARYIGKSAEQKPAAPALDDLGF
jgi:hypothetical protein